MLAVWCLRCQVSYAIGEPCAMSTVHHWPPLWCVHDWGREIADKQHVMCDANRYRTIGVAEPPWLSPVLSQQFTLAHHFRVCMIGK